MRRFPAFVLALALAPACDSSLPLSIEPATVLWSVTVGEPGAGPVVVGDRVLMARPGSIMALDPLTGNELWAVDLGEPQGSSFPAITAREGVAYGFAERIVAVRLTDGTTFWSLPAPPAGIFAADAERLYVIRPGLILALDPASGGALWEAVVPRPFGVVALGGGSVCLAGSTVQCWDGAEGRLAWSAALPDDKVAVDLDIGAGRTVVASTSSGAVVAYDQRTGTLLWSHALGAPLGGSTVAGLTVYACRGGVDSGGAGLCVALEESNGEERWKLVTRGGTSSPLVRDGRVVIVDERAIVELDAETGRVLRRIALPREGPFHTAQLAYSAGVLYARFFGELLAIRIS